MSLTNSSSHEQKTKKNVDTKVVDKFNSALRWVDINILPIIAIPVLCGLAAVGVMSKLDNLTDTAKLVISIAVAAFLGFKAHK